MDEKVADPSDVAPNVRFDVKPKDLQLAVGEIAELGVNASGDSAILYASAAPEIAEVIEGNRIAGRSPGVATITVSQGAQQERVRVVVEAKKVKEIFFVPSRAVVLVDGSLPVRLVGRSDQQHEMDFSPDQLVWERLPTASFADLDIKSLKITGSQPTGDQPQQAIAHLGQLEATLLIDVIAAPLRVELTPPGPVELPTGTKGRFTAWANYGNGRRVQLPPERVSWVLDPALVSGLELDPGTGMVRAIKSGVEKARVFAIYQGAKSDPVELKTIEAKNSIVLQTDRRVIMVGQTGVLKAALANTDSGVDITLENVKFASSDPKILTIDPHTGVYRVFAAGEVMVTASHPSAASGTAKLKSSEADKVSLEIRPAEIKLPVNGRQELELVLRTDEAQDTISLTGDNDIELAIGNPQAVQWNSPFLQGIAAAKPFELTVRYAGKTARGMVEVVPAQSAEAQTEIRIVPATASLVVGQSLSPTVEQRVATSDKQWQEVAPNRSNGKLPLTCCGRRRRTSFVRNWCSPKQPRENFSWKLSTLVGRRT